jgi:hypothetical protein
MASATARLGGHYAKKIPDDARSRRSLDEAIGLTQQALFALGPSHPQQADTMSLIALFFAKRYGETESPEDLQ